MRYWIAVVLVLASTLLVGCGTGPALDSADDAYNQYASAKGE